MKHFATFGVLFALITAMAMLPGCPSQSREPNHECISCSDLYEEVSSDPPNCCKPSCLALQGNIYEFDVHLYPRGPIPKKSPANRPPLRYRMLQAAVSMHGIPVVDEEHPKANAKVIIEADEIKKDLLYVSLEVEKKTLVAVQLNLEGDETYLEIFTHSFKALEQKGKEMCGECVGYEGWE